MKHEEKRLYLINKLIIENEDYKGLKIPGNTDEQKRLLRSLFNMRRPGKIGEEFLKVQDEYLQEAIKEKGITDLEELTPIEDGIYLWKGDITTLKCDAIVNAANSGMTGCYVPCHGCIDKAAPTSITQVYNKRMARCL